MGDSGRWRGAEHQQCIGEYLRLRTFDTTASERLARGSSKTRRYGSTARRRCWREREAGFAMNTVLAPADSVLRRTVGAARHKARALLTQRMTEVCRRRCATASTS